MNRRLLAAVGAVALVLGATAGIKVIRAGTPADGKHYGHVFVIMMENTGYRSLIGNPNAPWINRAVATYGVATSYYGVAHPSQPNYIEIGRASCRERAQIPEDAVALKS